MALSRFTSESFNSFKRINTVTNNPNDIIHLNIKFCSKNGNKYVSKNIIEAAPANRIIEREI